MIEIGVHPGRPGWLARIPALGVAVRGDDAAAAEAAALAALFQVPDAVSAHIVARVRLEPCSARDMGSASSSAANAKGSAG